MTSILAPALLAMPYGSRVTDEDGKTWTRKHLDRWLCEDKPAVVDSATLEVFYGPITAEHRAGEHDDFVAQLIRELATAHGRSVNAERAAHGLPPERAS